MSWERWHAVNFVLGGSISTLCDSKRTPICWRRKTSYVVSAYSIYNLVTDLRGGITQMKR